MSETGGYRIEGASGTDDEEREHIDDAEVEAFLNREREILGAYGLRGDIKLVRAKRGWAFDPKARILYYDPSFFSDRGYSLKETLFATTHELMAHWGELLRAPEIYLREFARVKAKGKEHLGLLHNIFEDVLGNRRIVAELPFLKETRTALYKEKLFPKDDYREYSRHVQFVYSFIREMMVQGEPVIVDDEVREALDSLRAFGAKSIDVLELVTTPSIEPRQRFELMRRIVEPVFLKLYRQDLLDPNKRRGHEGQESDEGDEASEEESGEGGKEGDEEGDEGDEDTGGEKDSEKEGKSDEGGSKEKSKKKKKGKAKGEEDEPDAGGGYDDRTQKKKESDRKKAEKRFKKEYKEYHDGHPEPIPHEVEEEIRDAIKASLGEKGGRPSMDRAILEQWAREHGLSPEDVLGYRKEFQTIAPLVRELREVFKQITARRLRQRFKLSPQLRTEGEELDDASLVEAYVESRAGGQPSAFVDTTKGVRETVGFGALDMTIVGDLSGSMDDTKLAMERKSAILFLEALADFAKEVKEAELESGVSLGLEVRTEARVFGDFGDTAIKGLGAGLEEHERIGVWRKLKKSAGGTPDFLSLEAIDASLTAEELRGLKEKRRRKVVVVLSDGESQDAGRVGVAAASLRSKGVIVFGLGMTDGGRAVVKTYAPDADVITDITRLPQAVRDIVLKHVSDL